MWSLNTKRPGFSRGHNEACGRGLNGSSFPHCFRAGIEEMESCRVWGAQTAQVFVSGAMWCVHSCGVEKLPLSGRCSGWKGGVAVGRSQDGSQCARIRPHRHHSVPPNCSVVHVSISLWRANLICCMNLMKKSFSIKFHLFSKGLVQRIVYINMSHIHQ